MSILVSVDTYNSDDWQKLKAAVSVLKNPVLDDSVLLEASTIGQLLHRDYIQSHSMPSVNLTDEEIPALQNRTASPFNYDVADEHMHYGVTRNQHVRRASDGGMLHPYRVQLSDQNEHYKNGTYASNSGDMTNDWVAGLPEYGRRTRSHTEPMMPPESILTKYSSKAKTLPSGVSLTENEPERVKNNGKKGTSPQLKMAEPPQMSPVHVTASKRTSVQSSLLSPSASSDTRPGSSLQSPTTPLTPNSKVVKVYMSRVQKGMP